MSETASALASGFGHMTLLSPTVGYWGARAGDRPEAAVPEIGPNGSDSDEAAISKVNTSGMNRDLGVFMEIMPSLRKCT